MTGVMKLFFEQSGTPLRAGQAEGRLSGPQAMWGLSWGSRVARDKLSLICWVEMRWPAREARFLLLRAGRGLS
jgi:hypothetical protein